MSMKLVEQDAGRLSELDTESTVLRFGRTIDTMSMELLEQDAGRLSELETEPTVLRFEGERLT